MRMWISTSENGKVEGICVINLPEGRSEGGALLGALISDPIELWHIPQAVPPRSKRGAIGKEQLAKPKKNCINNENE